MARRMLNRLSGRVFGWFDSKEARSVETSLPARFPVRARLALDHLEDRSVPATFTVINDLGDTSPGSLFDQITALNASVDATNTLKFDATFFSTAKTIALAQALPTIAKPVDIIGVVDGSSVNTVTINGSGVFNILNTSDVATAGVVTIGKLDFTAGIGTVTLGGALTIGDEAVTITNSNFSANTGVTGGAINMQGVGTLALNNCKLTGNSVTTSGGGIYLNLSATLNLTNCSITGNTASGTGSKGAGLYTFGSTVNITGCDISGNSSGGGGGGIMTVTAAGVTAKYTISNSTINTNTASNLGGLAGGGGAAFSFLTTAGSNTTSSLSITNSTLSGNTAATSRGGVVYVSNFSPASALSIVNVTISQSSLLNNVSAQEGGALHGRGGASGAAISFTISKSILSGNSSGSIGGALYTTRNNTFNIDQSTISNNFAPGFGGAIAQNQGSGTLGASLTITNSTLSGNSTNATLIYNPPAAQISGGGAIYMNGKTPTFLIRNTTISSNSSNGSGGAISLSNPSGTVTIQNSTFTSNVSKSASAVLGKGGGGIAISGVVNTPSLKIDSTVISGNSQTAGGAFHDVSLGAGITFTANFSAIGSSNGHTAVPTIPTVGATNQPYGAAINLDVLADNGGVLQGAPAAPQSAGMTHAVLVGSALIDAGSNPLGLTTDARGVGFPREIPTGKIDIGSIEHSPPAVPTANGTFDNITTLNGGYTPTYTFKVNYLAPIGGKIDTTTIDNGDITVTSPVGAYSKGATKVSFTDPNGDQSKIVATYSIPANALGDPTWDDQDNGVYTVTVNGTQVKTTAGAFVSAGDIGTFTVDVGNKYIVTITADSGPGSLRDAVAAALVDTPTALDLIEFNQDNDPGEVNFSTPQTISLLTALLVDSDMHITAPASGPVTLLQTAADTTVVEVDNNTTTSITAKLSNFVVTGGSGKFAGGIFVGVAENFTLNTSTVKANGGATTILGGGLTGDTNASITITNSTVSGNTATADPAGAFGVGGGVYFYNSGSLVVSGSTISGNVATGNGGGGGVYFFGKVASALRIVNSTVSGNSAPIGGGIIVRGLTGTLEVLNSTVSANSAVIGGGIARWSGLGTVTLTSSIVSGNVAETDPDITSTSPGSINATFSSVGVDPGAGWSASSKAPASKNLAFGASLFMTPLQNNGGPTATHGLTLGSAALDAGTTVPGVTPATDQIGNARVSGVAADIGAVEGFLPPPDASTTLVNIVPGSPADGKATYPLTVTYTAPAGTKIDTTTLGFGDLAATGPGGYSASASFVSFTDPNADQTVIVAKYTLPANLAGAAVWDIADNGQYTVRTVLNEVKTVSSVPVPVGNLGDFFVLYPRTFLVTNANDAGAGSLRDAITQANSAAFPAADTIIFNTDNDPGETNFSTPQTITVATELTVSDALSITGTGASLLTISGGTLSRIFFITETATTFAISKATLSDGGPGTGFVGGAVVLTTHDLATFDNVDFTNNFAGGGGGIAILGSADVVISNSTITNNQATNVNSDGGFILFSSTTAAGSLTITNATITGNAAVGAGAVASTYSNTAISVSKSTISGNTQTGAFVGGVFVFESGTQVGSLSITDSTVSNNSTAGAGGVAGIVGGAIITIARSTFDANTATFTGSVIDTSGNATNVLNVTDSTFSNNVQIPNGNDQGRGGTIFLRGGTGNITNSTFSGNSAACYSAVGFTGSVLNINNCTITNNTSSMTIPNPGFGGAVSAVTGGAVINLVSTIVSGNISSNARPDITTNGGTINATNSLIGSTGGATSFTFDAATTALIGQPALLDPLASNGGPTMTHRVQAIVSGDGADSPALNAGSNPLNLLFDQRGTPNARSSGSKADIGAYEVQVSTPLTVTGFTVNNGAAQRSRLTTITITFSGAVNPANFTAAGDITLTRTATTPVGTLGTIVQTGATGANGLITVTQPGPANELVLTFSNANAANETAGVEYGSLADGRWQLAVPSATFTSTLGDTTLRRLFGDFEGGPGSNGTVDAGDFANFGGSFGTSGAPGFSPFDYDNNGTIDSGDLGAIGGRFGFSV